MPGPPAQVSLWEPHLRLGRGRRSGQRAGWWEKRITLLPQVCGTGVHVIPPLALGGGELGLGAGNSVVKYLPGIYEAVVHPWHGGQGPPQGVGSQAEQKPVRTDKSSTWVYLQGASACSGRRVCGPDL